jgi:hypothetical protein
MKLLGFFLTAILVTGCTVTIPLQWSSEKASFPGGTAVQSSSPGAMAYRQSVINFPYADVFTSAESAMSFAQINVTESDQAAGIIYGTRSTLVKGFTKRFYYMLLVDENGPEKCTVSVYSKQQQSANYLKWVPNVILPSVGLAALSIGLMGFDYPASTISACLIYPVIMSPVTYVMNNSAKKNAELKWSPDDDEYLDRIMSFMRTDLLQK